MPSKAKGGPGLRNPAEPKEPEEPEKPKGTAGKADARRRASRRAMSSRYWLGVPTQIMGGPTGDSVADDEGK